MPKKKAVRKPGRLHTEATRDFACWCQAKGEPRSAIVDTEYLDAKDCRRLSKWLLRAADWIEAGEEKK